MTRRTNARAAGVAFLLYIAVGLTGMILLSRAAAGENDAAKLASLAAHASEVRIGTLLELAGTFCALVLGVTLYALTRDVDPELSLLALAFRTGEGVIGAVSLQRSLGRLWLATASGDGAPDAAATHALAATLLKLPGTGSSLSAIFFAAGSTVFSILLLRGRLVPAALAWLGVAASVLILVALPLELVDLAGGVFTQAMWLPMLAFELTLAVWLIVKGTAAPPRAVA